MTDTRVESRAIAPGRPPSWYLWGVLPDTTDLGAAGLPTAEDALAELYSWPSQSGGPLVRANMIASLDGGASIDGRSGGLGNDADRNLFAVLRDLSDVILVGSGTVRAEQYGGVRLDHERRARRLRWTGSDQPTPIAVVTGHGLDPDLPLFTDTVVPPIVITTAAAGKVPDGARVIVAGDQRIDLAVAVAELHAAGFTRIHCEGGPALFGALVEADLLDECCLTIAPILLGTDASPMVPLALSDPARWSLTAVRVAENHLFTRYRRVRA